MGSLSISNPMDSESINPIGDRIVSITNEFLIAVQNDDTIGLMMIALPWDEMNVKWVRFYNSNHDGPRSISRCHQLSPSSIYMVL